MLFGSQIQLYYMWINYNFNIINCQQSVPTSTWNAGEAQQCLTCFALRLSVINKGCFSSSPLHMAALNLSTSENRHLTAVKNTWRQRTKKGLGYRYAIALRISTHLALLPYFKVSKSTWRSRRMSGQRGADSCLTRGEGRPPHSGGTWHVPSNALPLLTEENHNIKAIQAERFSAPEASQFLGGA